MATERAQSLQDTFLNHVRKQKTPLTIFLVNGVKLQGVVTWFDNFCVLLRRDGHSQLVYKHAISTIMPGQPIQLAEITDAEIESLADIMSRLFRRMTDLLADPSFNYLLHVSPQYAPNLRFYHWHIEIIPSLTKTAGFEWGTGFYINPVPPEEAAAFLREVEVEPWDSEAIPIRETG